MKSMRKCRDIMGRKLPIKTDGDITGLRLKKLQIFHESWYGY